MLFTAPQHLQQALDAAAARSLLPTSGATAELRKLDADLRRRAAFSATTQSAEILQTYEDGLQKIVRGESTGTPVRTAVKQLLRDLGYAPDPEHEGGLQDLGSDRRINLKITTDTATVRGFGRFLFEQDADTLAAYPAQELYRAITPKGDERDWEARWIAAGGQFYGDRMIAKRDDPVWDQLGSSALFPDGLDNPYAPFAFGSGMRTRLVARGEAIALGVITAAEADPAPSDLSLNEDLKASPEVRSEWLRSAMDALDLGKWIGDVFHFGGSAT